MPHLSLDTNSVTYSNIHALQRLLQRLSQYCGDSLKTCLSVTRSSCCFLVMGDGYIPVEVHNKCSYIICILCVTLIYGCLPNLFGQIT